MTTPQKSASDAEAVAALIWMSFVVPEEVLPLEDDGKTFCSFCRALELYADTRDRERAAHEAELQQIAAAKERLLQELEAEAARPPVPDPDTAPAAQPPNTHTHKRGQPPPKAPAELRPPRASPEKAAGRSRESSPGC